MSEEKKFSCKEDEVTPFSERRKYEVRWLLASLYTIGYFGILLITFFVRPPDNNEDVLKMLLGLLSGIQVTIIQYYFGSSRDIAVATSTTNAAIDRLDKKGDIK